MTATTTTKTMPVEGNRPKFEVSAHGSGKLAGVDVQTMATYQAEMLPNGSMYGECPNAGLIMAKDGVATFRANGAGAMTEDGGSKFRGTAYFQASAPSLMAVNGKCMVYEWDVDGLGKCYLESLGVGLNYHFVNHFNIYILL